VLARNFAVHGGMSDDSSRELWWRESATIYKVGQARLACRRSLACVSSLACRGRVSLHVILLGCQGAATISQGGRYITLSPASTIRM
jgi:hypothetical protein